MSIKFRKDNIGGKELQKDDLEGCSDTGIPPEGALVQLLDEHLVLVWILTLKVSYYALFPHIKLVVKCAKDMSATCLCQNRL